MEERDERTASGLYVAVAGNIGAGKSSLTRILSERYHLSPVYEAVDENPYLEDFYRDMKRYAFHSQMFFLAARLRQHLRQVNLGLRVIQDRTVYEDAAIFARLLHDDGVMDDRDHASYRTMYEAVTSALRPPDLLIYLRASLPTLKRHIKQRGRTYEADIDDGYLERLGGLTSQGATALENARLVETLHHQGLHDPLSALPNRRLFRTRMNDALARGRRSGNPPAVIFIDLDDFKVLNDSFGHEAGDKVITEVAERLRSAVRAADTVARLGGDEFAVILENLNDPPVDAAMVAQKLVRQVREPITVSGVEVGISASAGAVVARATDDHDSLLRRADAHMYKAKSGGRDRAVAEAAG